MAGEPKFWKLAAWQAFNFYGSMFLVGVGMFLLFFGAGAVLSFVAEDALKQFMQLMLTSPYILLGVGGMVLGVGALWYKITAP